LKEETRVIRITVDERGIFYQSLVFSALSPLLGYLPLGIPYSLSKYHGTTGKYPARGEKVICTFMINQISCHTSMPKMTLINSTIN
jgi:hypothetical protein